MSRLLAVVTLALNVSAWAVAQDQSPNADPLPRRPWLGAALGPAEGGVRVREVFAGSSAEAAKLQPDDVIVKLGDTKVSDVPELIRVLRVTGSNKPLSVTVVRDGNEKTLEMTLKEWPREPATDAYSVEYASVASAGGRLRTITFVPKLAGPHPALLIIQGLGAATLDNPKPDEPVDKPTGMGVYRTLADALARDGYLVVRVDKGGCGDSESDPTKLDFNTELDGYRQALKAIKGRKDVDPKQVFIFGHSMGGVFGPMVAAENPVKGVAVYGTCVKPWVEYLAENGRRQSLLSGVHPADFDRQSRALEKFHHELHVNKKSPDQILKEFSDLTGQLDDTGLQGDQLFGRHYTFFQQLNDVNLPEQWSKVDAHVLALWGVGDFVTCPEDHELIAQIVNEAHDGKGTYQALAESDHGFGRAAGMKDAMEKMGTAPANVSRFNPEIIKVMREWLKKCNG